MPTSTSSQGDKEDQPEFYDSNDFFENGNSASIPLSKDAEKKLHSNYSKTNAIDNQTIIKACSTGDLEMIKKYLASGHDVNEFLPLTGWTLLLHAASNAQPNTVKYLLDCHANPNVHHEGYTPLMALCFSTESSPENRLLCLKYLIEYKADVNATDKLKVTPLMYACEKQELDFILEILKHFNSNYINYADSEQKTALFYAVKSGRVDVTKILIEKGADIRWESYTGSIAYDLASTKGYDELLPLLEFQKVDVLDIIETKCIKSWLDMFPKNYDIDENILDADVATLLHGMRLENYQSGFRGMSLNRFLHLKEHELEGLGIDMSVHRRRFVDELLRFHNHTWKNDVIKIDRNEKLPLFEAIKILGTMNKQLNVMSSSVYFSKNCLEFIENDEEINFTDEDVKKLNTGIQELQELASKIQAATMEVHHVAEMINEENSHLTSPTFISKNDKKNKTKWIFMTIFTLCSIYFFRTRMNRVWGRNSGRSWKNIFTFS